MEVSHLRRELQDSIAGFTFHSQTESAQLHQCGSFTPAHLNHWLITPHQSKP